MKIEFKKLDHVQICIPVGKESAARAFYTGILGMVEIPKPEQLLSNGGLWYRVAGIQLHIGVETNTGKSKRHPAFEVNHLNDIRSFLEHSGVVVNDEIQIDGLTRFSFKDPFDNRIELLEYNEDRCGDLSDFDMATP